jgi:hypothetical protein
MRLVRNRRLALAAGAILFSQALAASGLSLRVVEGNGMVVSPGAASARKIVIVAEDDAGQELSGVTIRFRLPAEGPSGRFASGLSSETAVTSADGRAAVIGIVWNDQPGRLLLVVSAALQGEAAQLEIPVEIGGRQSRKDSSLESPPRLPSSGIGTKKWLILAAAVGGAAALGVVASAMHGTSTASEPVVQPSLPVTPAAPVVGIPVIGIGTPGH